MDNAAKSVPVEAVYFENPEGAPSVLSLLIALDGVCSTLESVSMSYDDHEQLERVEQLGVAAGILARQLHERWSTRPSTKRELAEARKVQAQWREARERLAGPAEGRA